MVRILLAGLCILWGLSVPCPAAERTLTIATINAPPFSAEFLDKNGYGCDVVVQAFARAGYTAEIRFYSWNRSLEMCKQGLVDGVMPVWQTPERSAVFEFSDSLPLPYIMGIYKKKEIKVVTGGNYVLTPFRVGYVFGYAYPRAFYTITEGVVVDHSYSVAEMIEKLVKGRIDAAVVGRRQGDFILSREWSGQRHRFDFVAPPIKLIPRYIGFRKKGGYGSVIADFNRGLEAIRADGTLDRILSAHGIE